MPVPGHSRGIFSEGSTNSHPVNVPRAHNKIRWHLLRTEVALVIFQTFEGRSGINRKDYTIINRLFIL